MPGKSEGENAAPVAKHRVLVGRPGLAAVDAKGGHEIAIRQCRKPGLFGKDPYFANEPAATPKPARPAAVRAKLVAFDPKRDTGLDHFGRLDRDVFALIEGAHGMIAIGTIEGPGAARRILIEEEGLPALAVEPTDIGVVRGSSDIAGYPLGNDQRQRAHDRRIGSEADFVQPTAWRRIFGMKDRSLGHIDGDRRQRPGIDRATGIEKALDDRQDACRRDRRASVQRRLDLCGRPVEIGGDRIAIDFQRDLDLQGKEIVRVPVKIGDGPVDTVGQLLDGGAHPRLTGLQQPVDRGQNGIIAIARNEAPQPILGNPAGPDHGMEVRQRLVADSDIVEDQIHDLGLAGLGHPDMVQSQAFMKYLARCAAKAARRHATDIGPMGSDDDEQDHVAIAENRKKRRRHR